MCAQYSAAAAAKLLQSCPTLSHTMDCSPPPPPSLGFTRQEYWSGLPMPSPAQSSSWGKWEDLTVSAWLQTGDLST